MTSTNVSPVSLSDHPSSSLPWKDRTPADRLAAAQEFLRGTKPSFADLRDLAAALKDNDKRFTHARRLLVRARRHDDYKKQDERRRHKILQQLALCTYKDDDLPAERRFNRALDWLRDIATLHELQDQESLCLAGAIFKRQWETSGQIACLKRSLAFYLGLLGPFGMREAGRFPTRSAHRSVSCPAWRTWSSSSFSPSSRSPSRARCSSDISPA